VLAAPRVRRSAKRAARCSHRRGTVAQREGPPPGQSKGRRGPAPCSERGSSARARLAVGGLDGADVRELARLQARLADGVAHALAVAVAVRQLLRLGRARGRLRPAARSGAGHSNTRGGAHVPLPLPHAQSPDPTTCTDLRARRRRCFEKASRHCDTRAAARACRPSLHPQALLAGRASAPSLQLRRRQPLPRAAVAPPWLQPARQAAGPLCAPQARRTRKRRTQNTWQCTRRARRPGRSAARRTRGTGGKGSPGAIGHRVRVVRAAPS